MIHVYDRTIPSLWRVVLAAGILLLSACGVAPPRTSGSAALEMQAERETRLVAQARWSLQGKIAVSDGNDGGSGRIEWHQDGERFRIEIRAPVSRRNRRPTGAAG
jgi:outer membrane lipoprotein LolB